MADAQMSYFAKQCLYYLAAILGVLGSFTPLIYAPFASTWVRAIGVQALIGLMWAITRFLSIIFFNEESPPGIFFVIVPIESILGAIIGRVVKIILFKIPVLKAFEAKARKWLSRSRNEPTQP